MVINTREKNKALSETGQCVAFYMRWSRKGLTDVVILEQRHERNEEASPAGIQGKGTQAEGTASAKPPGRRPHFLPLRTSPRGSLGVPAKWQLVFPRVREQDRSHSVFITQPGKPHCHFHNILWVTRGRLISCGRALCKNAKTRRRLTGAFLESGYPHTEQSVLCSYVLIRSCSVQVVGGAALKSGKVGPAPEEEP